MKYKYEIGVEVKYNATESTDVECERCEHIETEYKDVIRAGVIESRFRDFCLDDAFGARLTMVKTPQDDGTTLITPTLQPLTETQKENFYRINGGLVHEDNIKGLI